MSKTELGSNSVHPTSDGVARAEACFSGPFRVTMYNGTIITPKGQVRQALLAVLCAAPDQIRSRRRLQDMFWGGASPHKASASLRNVLYRLRRDLELLGTEIIQADHHAIRLQKGRISTTGTDKHNAWFLEGMDLPLKDCEGFEDWLREMRQPALNAHGVPTNTHLMVSDGLGADRLSLSDMANRVDALERENRNLRQANEKLIVPSRTST